MAESSRDGIRDRFKNFILGKPQATKTSTEVEKQATFADNFWFEIASGSPLEMRIEKINEARVIVKTQVIEPPLIHKLWIETRDLLQPQNSDDVRFLLLSFLKCIIQGQFASLGKLRYIFFQVLRDHNIAKDFTAVMSAFEALTENGKDVGFFENDIGTVITNWLQQRQGNIQVLTLLVNIIKFNSSHLKHETIVDILNEMFVLCNTTESEEEMELALKTVDAVICYSAVPQKSIYPVNAMLCRTLNLKKFYNSSWKLMKNLLGTHLGHSCILTLCQILQDPLLKDDWSLMRNAVFYIGMSLWGLRRVSTLKHSKQSVLQSFKVALQANKNLVLAFEVSLTTQRLVKKYGHELQSLTWDYILDITSSLTSLMLESSTEQHGFQQLSVSTHELVSFIEQLYQSQVYDGSIEKLFVVIESCVHDRPDPSVFLLISYYMQSVNPLKDNWQSNLSWTVQKFFVDEERRSVRLKLLECLQTLIDMHFDIYQEELVAQMLIPLFFEIYKEHDGDVTSHVLQLLIHVCDISTNDTDHDTNILSILHSTLDHLWTRHQPPTNYDYVQVTVDGIIKLFKNKFDKYPGFFGAQAFTVLTEFIEKSCHEPSTCDSKVMSSCVHSVLQLLLSLRCNAAGNLGICFSNGNIEYSPYLLCKESNQTNKDDDIPVSVVSCNIVVRCAIECLNKHNSWSVVTCAMQGLLAIMQNQNLMVTSAINENISRLTAILCDMTTNHEKVQHLKDVPNNTQKHDLASMALSALSCLVSYHQWLDISKQRHILRNLEAAFNTKCAKQCVGTLTLCLIELPTDTVLRCLPSILIHISQLSSTVHMATATLELLAMLAQMKELYSNFVEDQYMSVFAVALHYTNPSKFSRYVVSLAHYVIVTWFVNCRLSFRADFVRYITRNLHAVNHGGSMKDDVEEIRNDLMETCIDVLARYSFSDCSTPPKRSALATFLFDQGASSTWLLGNRLITVTTSVKLTSKKLQQIRESRDIHNNKTLSFWPKTTSKRNNMQVSAGILSHIVSEAPGKLQTVDNTLTPSSRQRHKSGGAVLRRHMDNTSSPLSIDIQSLTMNEDAELQRHIDAVLPVGCSTWVEIYIRRPSGNTGWMMKFENPSQMYSCRSLDVMHLDMLLKEIKTSNLVLPHASLPVENEDSRPSSLPTMSYMDLVSGSRERHESDPTQHETSNKNESKHDERVESSAEDTALHPVTTEAGQRLRSRTVSSITDFKVTRAAMAARQSRRSKDDVQPAHFIGSHGNALSSLSRDAAGGKICQRENIASQSAPATNSTPINPTFVFLQLFQSCIATDEMQTPILLPDSPVIENAVDVLDRILAYDMWSSGVVYVAPGQGNEASEIFANQLGSYRYQNFIHGLGDMIDLFDCDPEETYVGGLAVNGMDNGVDGQFTYVWKEPMAQMVFHIATLMPTVATDTECNSKRRHLGNDHVLIVYDDGSNYKPGSVIKGQFQNVEVVIHPQDKETNCVQYHFHRSNIAELISPSINKWFVSDKNLPLLVRQLALHANMAIIGSRRTSTNEGYTSNTLARLKQIKKIRTKLQKENDVDIKSENVKYKVEEFSNYVFH